MAFNYGRKYGFSLLGQQDLAQRRWLQQQEALRAQRIAEERERISTQQWQPEKQTTTITTDDKGATTVSTKDQYPSGITQADISREKMIQANYGSAVPSDSSGLLATDTFGLEDPLGLGRPRNQWDQFPADILEREGRYDYERSFRPTQLGHPLHQEVPIIDDTFYPPPAGGIAVEDLPVDIPGAVSVGGMPVDGWGTGYQQDAPGMERMPAATDEDYRRAYGDQARVMGLRGLLAEEPELAAIGPRTIPMKPPNFAARTMPGYHGTGTSVERALMPPSYVDEDSGAMHRRFIEGQRELQAIPGTPEYDALVASIQPVEVYDPALQTADDAVAKADAAAAAIIPPLTPDPSLLQQPAIDPRTAFGRQDLAAGLPPRDITPWVDTAPVPEPFAGELDIFPEALPREETKIEEDIQQSTLESAPRKWIDPATKKAFEPSMYRRGVGPHREQPKTVEDYARELGAFRIRDEDLYASVGEPARAITEEDLDLEMETDLGKATKAVKSLIDVQRLQAFSTLNEQLRKKRSGTGRAVRVGRARQRGRIPRMNPTPLQVGGR